MSDTPQPRCPVRPGELCTLCHPGASGPQDCGLVYLVMADDELREGLRRSRRRRDASGVRAGLAVVSLNDGGHLRC